MEETSQRKKMHFIDPTQVTANEVHDVVVRNVTVLEAHVIVVHRDEVVAPAWFASAMVAELAAANAAAIVAPAWFAPAMAAAMAAALLPLTQALSELNQNVSELNQNVSELNQNVSELTRAVSSLKASRDRDILRMLNKSLLFGDPFLVLLNDAGVAPAAYPHTIQALQAMLEPDIDDVLAHYGIPYVGTVEQRRRLLACFLGVMHLPQLNRPQWARAPSVLFLK
jgi:hypothetical protein